MNTQVRRAFTAEELTHLFDQVPAIVWACDNDSRFTFSAGSALEKLGLRPHEVVGQSLETYFKNAGNERLLSHVRRALQGETLLYQAEWLGRVFESHVAPVRDAAGAIVGAVGVALDITDRLHLEEELLVNRYRVEHASALFPVVHYVLDASGAVTLTPEHCDLLGIPSSVKMLSNEGIIGFVHPDDRQHVLEARRLGVGNHESYHSQFRFVRPDGAIVHVRVHATPVFDEQGKHVRTIGTLTDVTGEVTRQREVTELLEHDGVTGLANRTYFTERLRHELTFASGSSELMALALFDLDRFSRINDSLGHLAGDEYLRTIASRLRTFQEGTQDLCARIGADEFGILLRGAQRRGDLVRRIESLRTALEAPAAIDETELHVSVSAGVAIYPYDASDITLMQKADLALSHARSLGSGHTEYYDLMLAEDVASNVRLEHGLHLAVRDSQLVPFYQPIVDREEHLTAVEALVRWNHPAYGVLSPSTFLDIAEESGLIVDLGEQILRVACKEIAPLRSRSPRLRLNVNLSSRHLLSRGLLQFIGDLLARAGLPRDALQVEVTEQSLIADVSGARRAIDTLRAFGIPVVIDDFGTGYNTLGYLKSYHVDGIKLDRMFVKDMITDRYSRAICEGVMAMAHSLHLPVIAEGVETTQQRDAVIAMGCEELQGFLFGQPMSANELIAHIR